MTKLLYFVDKTDPILREIMPRIKDFKDIVVSEAIDDMCYSILPQHLKETSGHENAAGMAANQWGLRKRIFIFAPEGSKDGKFEVILNPSYVPYLLPDEEYPELVAAYEGCFSIPLTAGLINRYRRILATYYTLQGDKQEIILEGFKARVFQHETDHLNGKLYDGRLDNYPGPECLERVVFRDREEMESFWINTVRPNREGNRE